MWPSEFSEDQKSDLLETAIGTIIFHLSDSIIRLVDKEDSPAKIWKKLDNLFQVKSLTNKIFLKERLFGYRMNTAKSLDQNLDEFLKMTLELANSGENEALSDENKAIIILNSLPDSFKEVKTAIKYGRTSITLDEVLLALRSKDLEIKTEKLSLSRSNHGENYYVRGRPTNRFSTNNNNGTNRNRINSKNRQRSTSRGPSLKGYCHHYRKYGHYKK